ncbi:SUMF1/EgtB/PvdO family nonheme iron enzyme [Bacteroidota bacterium]
MSKLILSLFFLISTISSISQTNEIPVEQKIKNIEKGLVEFKSPIDALQGNNKDTANLKNLYERMEFYNVPGLSVAVINDNKIDWAKSYGILKKGSDIRATKTSYFEAASTTKLLTAAITLHFVEKGILDLDEDVNNYLKRWKISNNEFTENQKVTLKLILSHQSGLNRPDGGFSSSGIPTIIQTLNGESPAEHEAAIIESVPGTEWNYSNFGYIVIQLIIEDVLNKPFSQIAQEAVFDKLGMQSSTFLLPLNEEQKKNEALPHDEEGIAHEPVVDPNSLAHAGLMTTASDLALFTTELMKSYKGESNLLFSQSIAQKLFHRELEIDPIQMFGLSVGEGLGVFLSGTDKNFAFLHPGGNYPGSECWLIGYPETGQGVIIMANGAKGSLLAMEIIPAISREYSWPKFELPKEEKDTQSESINESEEIEFVFVKGGSFEMGDVFNEGLEDEKPIHNVTVTDFYMSTTEITFAQYDQFCMETGKELPPDRGVGRGNQPVMNVTWEEVKAFCDYYGYRLPTEAEWEYAAREGGKKVRFANGEDIAKSDGLNFNSKKKMELSYYEKDKYYRKPLPVKSFPPNALGLYEMSGNQEEWCEDWYDAAYYKSSDVTNPVNNTKSQYKITRGGRWGSTADELRCTWRGAREPESVWNVMGFRVVKDVE